MNNQSDLEQLSIEELKRECDSLSNKMRSLETNKQASEDKLKQIRLKRQKLRDETQALIEQIVLYLLPDITDSRLKDLSELFPNEANLQSGIKTAQASLKISFWQRILNFLPRSQKSTNTLEQTRILLREVLWRIKNNPNVAKTPKKEFGNLLIKKRELADFDNSAVKEERKANDLIERYNALEERLNACQNLIKRRNRIYNEPSAETQQNPIISTAFDSDDDDYSYSDTHSSAAYDNSVSANQYQENNYESNSTKDEVFGGFSGGGGGFDGGGAGGSWENYS